ncbi:MAG: DUF3465 domain-containing protein, partial [Methylotenera sp.]
MKATSKNIAFVLFLTLALCACEKPAQLPKVTSEPGPAAAPTHRRAVVSKEVATDSANATIEQAFAAKKSDVQVSGKGIVIKLLNDDRKASQHQKFLVKINAKQTLLFAHNIDLAAKIPLQVGDEITFSGEYVYNPKGGIVHWTHHDPQGQHIAGWVMAHG